MSWKTNLASVALASATAVLMAQQQEAPAAGTTSSTRTTETTTQHPDGSTSTTIKTVTVSGEVVTYEPGRTIVIREPNKGTVTYTLDPGLTVPGDIQVGRRVMIYTEPGDGSVRVSRITTVTAPAAAGGAASPQTMSTQSRTTSTMSTTDTDSGAPPAQTMQTTTSTRMVSVSGTVQAYEPGQSITVIGPNSKTTTYTITTDSQLPKDVAVGKKVTVQTTTISGKPVVRSVQYKTTTKTVHTRTVSPQ
ncbi:MAG: hypothetical protein ABJC07_12450 [Acidobacteriota bacterium]